MPSQFQKAWAAASAACDSVFGEGAGGIEFIAKVSPLADVNARPVADPARPTFSVDGIFSEAAGITRVEGRGISSTNTHQVVAGHPTILISVPMLWQPRKGDIVRLKNSTPVRSFEIVEPHRHEGSTLFEVTPI